MRKMCSLMLGRLTAAPAAAWLPWLLLLQLGASVDSKPPVAAWDRARETVKQGEQLTLTCTVENVNRFSVVRLQRSKFSGQMDVIADNDNLKGEYADSGRYSVESQWGDTSVVITLTFSDIRGEDMGNIQCFGLGSHEQQAELKLIVQVPVAEVYILVQTEDGNEFRAQPGSKVYLRQGQQTKLACVAIRNGTTLPPDMAVTVAGSDEMQKFIPEQFPVPVDPSEPSVNESIEVHQTYETMMPDAQYNNKNLTCRATAEGYPPLAATIQMDVEYAPIITCPKYDWFGQMNRSMTIHCDIHANPGSSVSWYYGQSRDSAEAIVTSADAVHGPFVAKSKAFSDDHAHVSLTISRLSASHLGQFFLAAKNDIDASEITVTVKEGAKMKEPEVKVKKPNNPSYSTKNSPSKRPRYRDPQRVRSRGAAASASLSSLALLSSLLLTLVCQSSRR